MPSSRCPALFVSVGMCLIWLALASASFGQQVWSGYTYKFDHPANSAIQDDITPNVALTRDALRGIYNIAYEVAYAEDYSPEYTLWATEYNNPGLTIEAANWEALSFTDWRGAYGGRNGLANNIVDANAVVFLQLDEVYMDLRFTAWGIGFGAGGAFTYERAEPPSSEPTGDYNGNEVVDAADYTIWRDTLGQMVDNPGDGADGDASGTIDAPDYTHWKDHFGDLVPGAGAGATAIPEPTTIAQLFGGLLLFAARPRFTRQ